MDINIKRTGYSRGSMEVVVQHLGNELYFCPIEARGEQRRAEDDPESDANEYEIFHYINLYIATLPAVTQDAIFNCYQRINYSINAASAIRELDHVLRPLVVELMSYFDLDQIEHWMMLHSDVQIPTTLHENFSVDGRFQGTKEKTYLKHDYIKLVAMTIGLKAMMPVWTNYIEVTKQSSGPTWKQHKAYKLIAKTKYANCEAMNRLRIYIEASIDTQDDLASAIVEGISTEDFPDWLMAVTIIQKILITDIRGIPRNKAMTSPVLMSAIHKYVTGKIKRYETNFVGTVRDKRPEVDMSGDGENNVSRLENYKAREALSVGSITSIEVYFEDPINDPFIYQTMVNGQVVPSKLEVIRPYLQMYMQAMDVYNQLDQRTNSIPTIKTWQRAIVEWVLRDILPTRALEILSKPVELNCFAIAAAYLHATGYLDIALILTSVDRNEDRRDFPEIDKLSKDTLAILEGMYQHQLKGAKKNDKLRNAAVATIDLVLRDIMEKERYYALPQQVVETLYPGHTRRMVIVERNLRERMGKLIVELNK